MSRAQEVLNRLFPFYEAAGVVNFASPVKGLDFVNRKPITVPAGNYSNLGPDEEDPGKYVVLSNNKTRTFYLVDKKVLK